MEFKKNVNACRLRPLHDTHVWRDENGEHYSEIPHDRLPRTRNQSTSTSDDQQFDEQHLTNVDIEQQNEYETNKEINTHTDHETEESNKKRVTFDIPEANVSKRNLRPRNTLKPPGWLSNYEADNSE